MYVIELYLTVYKEHLQLPAQLIPHFYDPSDFGNAFVR